MRSREFDRDFRERSRRTRARGIGFFAVAGLLWGWCALLLLTPYEVDRKPGDPYPEECVSRLFTDGDTANEGLFRGDFCENERDWPEALAVLGLSVPAAVVGAVLFTSGSVSCRMSAHAQAMRELDRLSDPPRA
ncbi:hypothetical protein [Streptomyces lycii]|uniref:Transmembrane protein n=1 Tax=Streptomyces lycii TaxID=2654337 RepID=A0ABQ7FMP4_9ACTN|nr:hypothetical protein [Streptomyces lycii]KAF4410206.1 hypothetical protein GCU69_05085 [Streptomyces lycii]